MSIHTDGGRLNARPVARGEAVEVRTAAVVTRTVDVIIAAWNRSDTIERAILSALAEPEVRHVIVVDDGSSDDTAARARQCNANSGRVIVERLCWKLGPSAARNVALRISTAPWVSILDSDDYLLPGRTGALLSKADGWDFIADDLLQARGNQVGEQTLMPILFDRHFDPWPLSLERFLLGNVSRRGALRRELGFLKPLIRRPFLDHHQLRYDERLRLGEDHALYARALAAGARFLIVPAAGYVSVVRDDSISSRHSREDLERLRDSDVELMAKATLTASEHRALKKHYASVDCRVQWLVVIEVVKARKYVRFLAAFCRSPKVSLFLMERLFEELVQRLRKASAGRRAF